MARFKAKRCQCGKAIFHTKEEAHRAIRGLPMHPGYGWLQPYRCLLRSHVWHVGHNHKMLDRVVLPVGQ